jgi:hypothetical protein
MFSISTIRVLSDKAAIQAAQRKRKPFVFWDAEEAKKLDRIPFIGHYQPEGWEQVSEVLVDTTGLDEEGPALSVKTFVAHVIADLEAGHGYGYAIVERGQFQCRIGTWKPTPEVFEPGKSEGPRNRR